MKGLDKDKKSKDDYYKFAKIKDLSGRVFKLKINCDTTVKDVKLSYIKQAGYHTLNTSRIVVCGLEPIQKFRPYRLADDINVYKYVKEVRRVRQAKVELARTHSQEIYKGTFMIVVRLRSG